jgi:heavy metal translocating P-type ATPase
MMLETLTPVPAGGGNALPEPFFSRFFLNPGLVSSMRVLESFRLTTVSGVFLAVSFLFWCLGFSFSPDPAWAAILISGIPLVNLALKRLFIEKTISSALLIVMAMAASIYVGEIFAAGEVALIMAVGALLEERTVEKSATGLKNLVSLVPAEARLIPDGDGRKTRKVRLESVQIGDRLRVLPGETIGVDGVVVFGHSSVDEKAVTGESLPRDKAPGDKVFSGTQNINGSFDFTASRQGAESTLQKIIALTEEAAKSKAPMARLVDKWAAWLVPAALLIALFVYLITGELTRGVTILVVFCPCALVLATPVSIVAAIGRATKKGVIIKSGAALEALGNADVLCLDKTGTLTLGKPFLSEIVPAESGPDTEDQKRALLQTAASAELLSEHPLARVLVEAARAEALEIRKPEDFRYEPGKGVSAFVKGTGTVICGNAAYLRENRIILDNEAEKLLDRVLSGGRSPILCAVDGKFLGLFGFLDTVKEGAEKILLELSRYCRLNLLTGDEEKAALALFGQNKALSDIVFSMSPADKARHLNKLKAEGFITAMAGDGVNDAPALKTADVGIAMGALGSDIAIEASDIVLMNDDLDALPFLKKLSLKTLKTIKLNITLSMIINALAIILSAFGVLTPVTGALVHNAGSTLVILNGARLYQRRI